MAGIQLSENGLTVEPHFIGLDYVKATHCDISVEFNKKELKIKSGRNFKLKLNGKETDYMKGEYVIKEEKLT